MAVAYLELDRTLIKPHYTTSCIHIRPTSFVIDRWEVQKLFKQVRAPTELEASLAYTMEDHARWPQFDENSFTFLSSELTTDQNRSTENDHDNIKSADGSEAEHTGNVENESEKPQGLYAKRISVAKIDDSITSN